MDWDLGRNQNNSFTPYLLRPSNRLFAISSSWENYFVISEVIYIYCLFYLFTLVFSDFFINIMANSL